MTAKQSVIAKPPLTPCDVEEARELLKKPSAAAVYMAAARNQIPHRRFGRRIIFFREELVEFLDSQPGVTLDDIRDRE